MGPRAQLDISWTGDTGFDGDFDKFFAGQINGLVGAAAGDGLYLNLARRSGGSAVRIMVLDVPPGEPGGDWEDVVEVSATVPVAASPIWSSWAFENHGTLDLAPGTYRVRVSARGRDAGRDGKFADGVVDTYLVELWSAPGSLDTIVRTSSADAAYWHHEVGGRR